MEYTFSWGSFFIGILILLASGSLTLWHRQIADAIGSGVNSYSRYQLWGLIGCGLGLIVMLNLHTVILTVIFSSLFNI